MEAHVDRRVKHVAQAQRSVRFQRWDEREAGSCNVDTVAHRGGSGDGEFVR